MPDTTTGMPAPPQAPKKRSFLKRLFGGKENKEEANTLVRTPPQIDNSKSAPGMIENAAAARDETHESKSLVKENTKSESEPVKEPQPSQAPQPRQMEGFTVYSSSHPREGEDSMPKEDVKPMQNLEDVDLVPDQQEKTKQDSAELSDPLTAEDSEEITEAIDSVRTEDSLTTKDKQDFENDYLSKAIQAPKPETHYDPKEKIIPNDQKLADQQKEEERKRTVKKSKPAKSSLKSKNKKLSPPPKPKELEINEAKIVENEMQQKEELENDLDLIPEPDFPPQIPPLEDDLDEPQSEPLEPENKQDEWETQERPLEDYDTDDLVADEPTEKPIEIQDEPEKQSAELAPIETIPVVGLPKAPKPTDFADAHDQLDKEQEELDKAHNDLLEAHDQFVQAHEELDNVHEELKDSHAEFEDAHKDFVDSIHRDIDEATERKVEDPDALAELPEIEAAPKPEDFLEENKENTKIMSSDSDLADEDREALSDDESQETKDHDLLTDLMDLPPPVHPKEERMPGQIHAVGKKTSKSSVDYEKDIEKDFDEIDEIKKTMKAQLEQKEKELEDLENELSQKRQELDKKQSEIIEKEELIEKQKSEYQQKLQELDKQRISDSKIALDEIEEEKEMHKKFAADLKRRETHIKNEEKRLKEHEKRLEGLEEKLVAREKEVIEKEKKVADRDRIVTNKINKVNSSLEKINHEISEKEDILKVLIDEIDRTKPALEKIKSLIKYHDEKNSELNAKPASKNLEAANQNAPPRQVQYDSVEEHLKALHGDEEELDSQDQEPQRFDAEKNELLESDADDFIPVNETYDQEIQEPSVLEGSQMDEPLDQPIEIEDVTDNEPDEETILSEKSQNESREESKQEDSKKDDTEIEEPKMPFAGEEPVDSIIDSKTPQKPQQVSNDISKKDELIGMIESSKSFIGSKEFEKALKILEDAKNQLKNSKLDDKERKILKYTILETETDINLAKLES